MIPIPPGVAKCGSRTGPHGHGERPMNGFSLHVHDRWPRSAIAGDRFVFFSGRERN